MIMALFLTVFCAYVLCVSGKVVLFSNSWAVEVKGGLSVADRIARNNGFINRGQVGSLEDIYHFVHVLSPLRTKREANVLHPQHHRLKSELQVGYVEQQSIKRRFKRSHSYEYSTPSSVKWKAQWYLHRSNSHDMNVEGVWEQNVTGRGAVVSILDDGIEYSHPDLQDNYDPQASYDFNDHDDDPMPRYDPTNENKHGTRCAGEIAANKGSRCGVGVAFGSKVGGVRMLDGDVTDVVEASSLSLNPQHIDIYSSSWGPNDDGRTVDGPGKLAFKAFLDGTSSGRNGLGSIFVWAAGNGGRYGDSCNCDGYAVSPLTISVGSASEHDKKPWYLEQCSSTLTSTYSSGAVNEKQIITTDIRMTCTERHTGTSASAPLAAGMMALALEVNPNLTWRDMQYLMVYSSNPKYPEDDGWHVNGAGLRVSHWYGFGIIDGEALVNRARNWITVPKRKNCTINATARFNENEIATSSTPLSLHFDVSACELVYLEHVQAITSLRLLAGLRKGVSIYLTSPSGTKSTLLPYRTHDRHKDGFHLWPFMTVHSWGEQPQGSWNFEVNVREGEVKLESLQLVFYGVQSMPSAMVSIPTHCHSQCKGGCAQSGPRYCDDCKHYRLSDTLECVGKCPPGYYPNNNFCRLCPTLCTQCSNAHSCIRCDSQAFHLLNGTCSKRCPEGTFAASNKSCILCHQSCVSCGGPLDTSCISCPPQFTLYGGTCVISEENCPLGQYFDHRAHECHLCHESCASCHGKDSTQCITCFGGAEINAGGQCVDLRQLRSCHSGQYFDNLECTECPLSCGNCSDGSTCTTCPPNMYLTANASCVELCPAGTLNDSEHFVCLKNHCDHPCQTCFGLESSLCSSCVDGLMLFNHSCVEKCPQNCFEEDSICTPCHTDCASCVGPAENQCITCSGGRLFSDHSCVPHCPVGTFNKEGVCVQCMADCISCGSQGQGLCDQCRDGYYLFGHPPTKCVPQCPPAYAPSLYVCHPCPLNCATCFFPSRCHSCQPGFVYYAPSRSCQRTCPDGYYASQKGQCKPCQLPCSTCIGSALNCSTCSTGMVFDTVTRACRECCNADKAFANCCNCDLDTLHCRWLNSSKGGQFVTSRSDMHTNSSDSSHVLIVIGTLSLLSVAGMVLLVVFVVFVRIYSTRSNRHYQKVPQDSLDIVGNAESGSDTDDISGPIVVT